MSGPGGARRHWWLERITSGALIPLSIWLVYALGSQDLADRQQFEQWIGQTGTIAWLGLFFLASLYHARLGLEVIVDDYISDPAWNGRVHFLVRGLLFLSLVAAFAGLAHFLP